MPVTLVGANVQGKPNYITIAHVGIIDFSRLRPITEQTHYTHLCLSIGKDNYTNEGIKENGTFSVNIPSTRLKKETDYCSLVSGRKADKGALFTTFFGKLKTAPMIKECPLNMECRLVNTVDMLKHDVFIGEVVETYCNEEYLVDGSVDFSRIDPIVFTTYDPFSFNLGER